MKNLKEKLRKNGGFTLIEMLIVVAIIAILIAVSIPMVGTALERARESTDAANERAFKAELLIQYLNTDSDAVDVTKLCKYNAATGQVVLVTDAGAIKAYGQGTSAAGAHKATGSGTQGQHEGLILIGNVDAAGSVCMKWSAATTNSGDALTASDDLTSEIIGTTTAS